jgi:hypothetical protein
MVATRKIAARVSGADTGCATRTESVCGVVSAMKSLARVFMSGRRAGIKAYLLGTTCWLAAKDITSFRKHLRSRSL